MGKRYNGKQQCQVICEKLVNPNYEQLELEKELRAFICSYLWSCSDWKEMKEHPAGRVIIGNGKKE